MASFSAKLYVGGQSFPVLHCSYGVSQATHQRGRVSTKVRYEPVQLTLDVPAGEVLLAWAASAHKQQEAAVVFDDGAGGSPLETLRLAAAYCVGYHEQFRAGNTGTGAYVCHLVLSDPAGFTIQAGGPAGPFTTPAAGTHGLPGPPPGVGRLASMGIGGAMGATSAASTIVGAKEPIIPLDANIAPANWKGKKDLPSWTKEHKEARWAGIQCELPRGGIDAHI